MQSGLTVTFDRAAAERAEEFESLVRDHKDRIYGYVCRLTNDSPDAEDLTQEVFVRAYQSIHSFRRDAAVDTWLYRIATNLVIDRFRREKRAPRWVSVERDEDQAALELPAVGRYSDPQASAQLGELQRQVRLAVQALPEKLRSVVVLHDLEGLAYDEIARVLGCPLGTIKSRLFNARTALKRKLAGYLGGEE